MVDHTLHGNCERCPACAIRREALDLAGFDDRFLACNRCAGYGLIPIPVAQIIARAAEEARRSYWPALEARWAAQNGESPGVPRASIFAESANNPPIWVQLELPAIRR